MDTARLILLGLLRSGARYGYQLHRMLQEERYRDWAGVPVASLYRELARLADAGLIERVGVQAAGGRPARVLYRLTAAGEEELRRLLREALVVCIERMVADAIAQMRWVDFLSPVYRAPRAWPSSDDARPRR